MRILPVAIAAALLFVPFQQAIGQPVTASRLSKASDDPEAYLIDGHYLRDEAAIAKMRDRGDLPDTIPDGKCNYQLAGDPSVVYYVRDCN